MKLYGSPTSPYVRKARVLLHEKAIEYEFVPEDPWPEDSLIPTRNPLGKVPALEISDGNYLFESVVVVQYIDAQAGKPLEPKKKAEHYWKHQWWMALSQGILDAAVTRIVETRRPEEKQMQEKLEREEARIHRAIDAAENAAEGGKYLVGKRLSLADLMMGVALQYVDFRYPHEWRKKAPRLAKWFKKVAARDSFQATMPPGFTPPKK
jgi:glutathione S-transferase